MSPEVGGRAPEVSPAAAARKLAVGPEVASPRLLPWAAPSADQRRATPSAKDLGRGHIIAWPTAARRPLPGPPSPRAVEVVAAIFERAAVMRAFSPAVVGVR